MAYIKITSTGESYITAAVYGLDSSYSKDDRVCTWYLDGSKKGTSFLGAEISSGGSYRFSGLDSGTSYEIMVSITAPGWTIDPVELYEYATTDKPSIELWSWTSSNGDASATQTKAAYTAITEKRSTGNFSYLVWNDMLAKVYEILDATGSSWNSKYASYSATKMYSGGTLTATKFNSLRYNIGIRYSTGINDVYKGDIVYGSYFVTLANCINGWINSL